MKEYMSRGIKELIDDLPEVGGILERYGIGCVPCTVGTCKVADVVQIHKLSPADEAAMMAEVERVIRPDREAAPRPIRRTPRAPVAPRRVSYSPPVRRLVDEHTWIKRLLALMPAITERMQAAGEVDRELARGILDFIRGYADRFHHMKEEDILFDYTDREAEVIQVMLQDHDRARSLVRAAAEAVEAGDCNALCANLLSYRDLLTEHITKEDDVLYPYIDRGLTDSRVGEVFRRFEEVDGKTDPDVPDRYLSFITRLEEQYVSEPRSAPKQAFQSTEEEPCHTVTTGARAPA